VSQSLTVATLPIVRFRLDEAAEKNYTGGVVGIQARPIWTGPAQFEHHGRRVVVTPCGSSLAVREALLGRPDPGWLVVITDRDPDDLGDGILTHVIGHRFRPPDEWEALRLRFSASGLDPALQRAPHARELAAALLSAEPADGWPPAPGGVLTADHAMTAVFRHHLGLSADDTTIDGTTILSWASDRDTARRIADLRAVSGDRLADAALEWAARRVGPAREPVLALLNSGRPGDVVPLGLIAALLTDDSLTGVDAAVAREATIRLESRLGGLSPSPAQLGAWAGETRLLTSEWDTDASRRLDSSRVRGRADELLVALQATPLAVHSDLLPSGLVARLSMLAEQLRHASAQARLHADDDPEAVLVRPQAADAIEQAWAAVLRHVDAGNDPRVRPFASAVRLCRWLARNVVAATTMRDLISRHLDDDAWVDVAVNDAAAGAGDAAHAAALHAVLEVVRRRRDTHDRAFARALAVLTAAVAPTAGVRFIEAVLIKDVAPLLARRVPVLLLVADGMSVATAIEVMTDSSARGWHEYGTGERRAAAVAALPTLTEVSRASLLCGELTTGSQREERAGLAEFARARGDTAKLFHKKLLDSSRPGFAVSDEVGTAIDDTTGTGLVACVLNTVDDALDRSDPGGTDWTVDAIKHLRALLERAQAAGRVVVLTSDHGHVVERRLGYERYHPDATSNRSRPAVPDAAPDEVLVAGPRVLLHDGRAVLAVDERLRYGPLKAGYHGGASPAEVLVPVLFLVSGTTVDTKLGDVLHPIGDPTPLWWNDPAPAPTGSAGVAAAPVTDVGAGGRPAGTPARQGKGRRVPDVEQQSFPGFDLPPDPAAAPTSTGALVDAVVGSGVYAAESRLAGRAQPTTTQLREALSALMGDPSRRRPMAAVTASMASGPGARGAFAMLQRVLNVEGYPVLGLDPDGVTAVLDEELLREQFQVRVTR